MQYHYDIVDTIFGKFFILDSSKGLHFLIKNNDPRVNKIKKQYSPIKNLFNSDLKIQITKYTKGELKKFSCKINFLNGSQLRNWEPFRKLILHENFFNSPLVYLVICIFKSELNKFLIGEYCFFILLTLGSLFLIKK